MTPPVTQSPTTLEVAPGVRFAKAGNTFVVFNSSVGKYFTLTGEASRTWGILTTEPRTEIDSNLQVFLDALVELKLVLSARESTSFSFFGDLPQGIHMHTELEHLILRDPLIDLTLLGNVHESSLQESNRRTMVERLRVRRFISSVFQDAHRYAAAHVMLESHVDVGQSRVRIQVPTSDRDMPIQVAEAFIRPAAGRPVEADFCITVIDDSGDTPRRSTDFGTDWHFPLGLLDSYITGDSRVAVDRHTQTVSVYSPSTRQSVVWTKDFSTLPYWSAATPLRLQLSWIADSLHSEFLHASAVKVSDGAVVFAGPSGAGKSTVALLLAQQGYPLIADDFVVATPEGVQGIYKRVKVHDSHLDLTMGAGSRILNPDSQGEKRIVELDSALISGITPITSIVVPEIGTNCVVEPLDPGEALSIIAPPSLSGLLGGNPSSLQRIARLVAESPCYRLTLDSSIFTHPRALNHIIEQLA